MLKAFCSFRWEDQVLVVAFVIFAISIVLGLVITSKEEIAVWTYRKVNKLIEKLQEWTAILSDDEPFDASWMDAEKYAEANR